MNPYRITKQKGTSISYFFQRIYSADRHVKALEDHELKPYRKKHVRPILEELRQWVDTELETNKDPKSTYGKALTYITRQWPKLIHIMNYVHVELSNNLIENKIRPLVLGCKNYLFAESHDAAQRIAMYSFFESCKTQDINLYYWLKVTLEKITDTKLSDLETLLLGYGV